MPGARQVVAGGLAGAVGAVGFVGVLFGEGGRIGRQRAVHLVGGNVQKAESRLVRLIQRQPVGAGRFEQAKGANDVGGDEVLRAVYGAVHMAFGGKVHDGARAVFGQQAGHQGAVANVALHENVARIALQAGQIGQIARVGELVKVEHRLVAGGQPVEHEIAADETGPAGDKNHGKSLS